MLFFSCVSATDCFGGCRCRRRLDFAPFYILFEKTININESFAFRLSLLLDVAKVFIHDFTCHNFDQAREGETRLFMVCDQKRDQAKSKASEIFFRNFCRKSSFTRATRLAAPKMVNFCAKTKRNIHVWNSLPYPTEFFTPTFKFIDWFLKNKFEPSTNGDSVV